VVKWNQFVNGDCFDVLEPIENQSVDLVFTSPPDISQTDWGKDTKLYTEFQRRACSIFNCLVKDDGFVLIAQTDR